MMVALARENPTTFKNNDFNNLIVGASLQVPGRLEIKPGGSQKAVGVVNKTSNVIEQTNAHAKVSGNLQNAQMQHQNPVRT